MAALRVGARLAIAIALIVLYAAIVGAWTLLRFSLTLRTGLPGGFFGALQRTWWGLRRWVLEPLNGK